MCRAATVRDRTGHLELPTATAGFVIGDVGTTIYVVGSDNRWARQQTGTGDCQDWAGRSHADIKSR